MREIVVMGASGMLGSMVTDVLSRNSSLHVRTTVRSQSFAERGRVCVPEVEWTVLDVEATEEASLSEAIAGADWVINAVGIIKPYIHDENDEERERALLVNSLFPYWLVRAAGRVGAPIVQIATDCVFSGDRGRYTEEDPHDALDVYGKTKSLGEIRADSVHHLRCSIVGPEPKAHVSLLDWFLDQPQNTEVNGFTNHHWNGITTFHFAKICEAIVAGAQAPPSVQHIIPTGTVAKADLLGAFAQAFQRTDVKIRPTEAEIVVDRTLETVDASANRGLWQAAGYAEPPTVSEMVTELAAFDYRFREA